MKAQYLKILWGIAKATFRGKIQLQFAYIRKQERAKITLEPLNSLKWGAKEIQREKEERREEQMWTREKRHSKRSEEIVDCLRRSVYNVWLC